FSSRRRHTRFSRDWSSDVCSSDLAHADVLHRYGGSPIGNSRVKLTNVKDCVKRGLVQEGQNPQQVAADQLVKDGVDILHTIGGRSEERRGGEEGRSRGWTARARHK